MNRHVTETEHDRVDALLPWYVSGTLVDAERAIVEAHVNECADCRDNLALLRDIESAVHRDAPTPLVPPARPGAVLAAIDAAESRRTLRRRAWLAAACVGAVSVFAAALYFGYGGGNSTPAIYETATSAPPPGTIDYIVELRFEPGIDDDTRSKVLQDVAGPAPPVAHAGGAYRVVLSLDAATLSELADAVSAIEARPGVASARVVAVQLPVE